MVLVLVYRNPVWATAAGFASGFLAGMTTGILHTKFKINGLLAGILVMTALYSVNLHVMGKSNVSAPDGDDAGQLRRGRWARVLGGRAKLDLLGWEVATRDWRCCCLSLAAASLVGIAALCLLPHRPGHRHARHRRLQPDDPRAWASTSAT